MSWKKYRKIGGGSYGTVYLAAATNSPAASQFIAVKTAKLEKSSSLMKEVEFLKHLNGNPYVIQCYGEDKSMEGNQGFVYNLLLEYAPGGTLGDLIRSVRGIMPEILVAYYSYMLLRGISHVHRKDLVHCDIKPSNILVFKTQKGLNHLKLADFGLSKYVWEKETKRFRGTPIYASPESIGCGLHGRATDIWSFGCTVLEMMMGGRSIWSDNISTLDMFNLIVQGPPEIPQYVSEVGRDFLMRCFQINADERWTADMLLNHPFIKENTKGMFTAPGFERSNLIQMNNPFGSWISTEGLFSWSSPPAKQPSQCATSYQLFPEGKRPRDMILGGSSYLFRQSFAIWVEAFANDLFAFD